MSEGWQHTDGSVVAVLLLFAICDSGQESHSIHGSQSYSDLAYETTAIVSQERAHLQNCCADGCVRV